ncbi:MAG: ABC transporter permease [Pirellulales bacterium]|nr:ABC transporter permease [Pirellulales bacterium]
MSISRIYAVFLRQVFLIRSNPTRLVSMFLWIIMDVILWGFITKYLGSLGRDTLSFVNIMLGAIILWGFTTRIEHGVMTTFLEDTWSRNLINYFASPLQIDEYICGLVVTSIAMGICGLLLMLLIAGLCFGYNIFAIGFYLLPFLLVLFIFGIAIGIFVSALIFRLGPAAEWIGWPIPMVLSVFSGVFYPVSNLPKFLRVVSRVLPASYVFESMRAILMNRLFPGRLVIYLCIGLALSCAYLLVTYFFFVRVYRYNLKHGTIARFNIE